MNLLFISIVQKPNGSWLFTWTPTAATFYRVILFGKVLNGNVTQSQYLYQQAIPAKYIKMCPPIEVVEENNLAVSEIYQPYVTLQWYNDGIYNVGVAYYQVQQYNGTNWINGPVIIENGSWVYSIVTPILSDGNTYNFRVIAVGLINQKSCALPFSVNMVCCPVLDDDSFLITYDTSLQEVVVAAE